MADRSPDPASNRTHERAFALAVARGCEPDLNPCWDECLDAALSTVIDRRLDEWERQRATTSEYWRLTHGAAS